MKGLWLLPSRGRVFSLRRFFRGCREMGVTTPGVVLVNHDEYMREKGAYAALDLPPGWSVAPVVADCMQGALRAAWSMSFAGLPPVGELDWIGLLQDDLLPGVPSWDTALVDATNGWNVVSAGDGSGQGRMQGAIVWSGKLLRALGWNAPYPPGLKHLYGDDVWEHLAAKSDCWLRRFDIITRHLNDTYALTPDDTARRVAGFTAHDKETFEAWKASELEAAAAKIIELKKSMGVTAMSVDLRGVSLLIATPAIDARYESHYVSSLFQTISFLTSQGVSVRWAEEKYNADICHGRSKLIGAFRRSGCSHMLKVDSDMGWDIGAVMRLFAAKKDIVAVAGPKKSYPLRFAANYTDAAGNVIPLPMEPASGTAEVHHVGAAFMLITRSAVERLCRAYPELEFDSGTGDSDHGLFMPQIVNKRYYAEDFAFCNRWRRIGGKIHICPDVRLKHTGTHTFEGALVDQFKPEPGRAAPPSAAPPQPLAAD